MKTADLLKTIPEPYMAVINDHKERYKTYKQDLELNADGKAFDMVWNTMTEERKYIIGFIDAMQIALGLSDRKRLLIYNYMTL